MRTITELYESLRGDKVIWLIVGLLGLFSILAVYSATGSMAFSQRDGNTEYYLIQQIVFIILGGVVMYLCYNLHYMQYSKWAPYLLLPTLILLVWTIFFGTEINEARRWITIPWIDKTIQTSDLAKLTLIIFIARSLSKRQDVIKDFKTGFLPVLAAVSLTCLLIVPADLSTAALLFLTCMLMMYIGRVNLKYIFILFLFGALGMFMIYGLSFIAPDMIRIETWISRINEYLYTDGGYQIEQSKIAIANGGWFGVGPGESFQKNYLPYPYADFIYAIICEEYGIVGALFVLGLYLWLLVRCIGIVTRCPKAFGAILAMGLCLNLVIQAFANIAVSVHLLPVTGLTLPLVSMGGTSMIFTCMSLGIILSVSRYVEEAEEKRMELLEIEVRDAHSF
jgi:cell division protein FtsW